jgi:predicted house-cleaning noncanonical NTP pyrophosphatase (MazG superfamily)
MKKYITLLIAVAITSSLAFAVDGKRDRPERPKRPTLEQQIERIGGILEDADLSDRKKAYLENRLAVLGIQSEFRAALKEKMAELGKETTKEEHHEAMKTLRESFSEALDGLKVNRREVFERRRQHRKKAGDGE